MELVMVSIAVPLAACLLAIGVPFGGKDDGSAAVVVRDPSLVLTKAGSVFAEGEALALTVGLASSGTAPSNDRAKAALSTDRPMPSRFSHNVVYEGLGFNKLRITPPLTCLPWFSFLELSHLAAVSARWSFFPGGQITGARGAPSDLDGPALAAVFPFALPVAAGELRAFSRAGATAGVAGFTLGVGFGTAAGGCAAERPTGCGAGDAATGD